MTSQLIGQVSDALKLDVRTITRAERLRAECWQRVRKFLEVYDYMVRRSSAIRIGRRMSAKRSCQ